MAINTNRLYDSKALRFGTATSSASFQQIFLDCLLKTIEDVNNYTGMDVDVPEDVYTDIDLDNKYYTVISTGLDYHLQDSNLFTTNVKSDIEAIYTRAKREAQHLYLSGIDMGVRFGTLS